MRCSVRAVPRAYHQIHLGGFPLLGCQSMTCEQSVNTTLGRRNLACRGPTFMSLDGTTTLLEEPVRNVASINVEFPPSLASQFIDFEEVLDWLQLAFTGERTGAYVVPAAVVVVWTTTTEGKTLFAPTLSHIQRCFPQTYARRLYYKHLCLDHPVMVRV